MEIIDALRNLMTIIHNYHGAYQFFRLWGIIDSESHFICYNLRAMAPRPPAWEIRGIVMDVKQMERKSIQYRKVILRIIKQANAGHTAGSLSCIDILNVLYNHVMNISPDNFSNSVWFRWACSRRSYCLIGSCTMGTVHRSWFDSRSHFYTRLGFM